MQKYKTSKGFDAIIVPYSTDGINTYAILTDDPQFNNDSQVINQYSYKYATIICSDCVDAENAIAMRRLLRPIPSGVCSLRHIIIKTISNPSLPCDLAKGWCVSTEKDDQNRIINQKVYSLPFTDTTHNKWIQLTRPAEFLNIRNVEYFKEFDDIEALYHSIANALVTGINPKGDQKAVLNTVECILSQYNISSKNTPIP